MADVRAVGYVRVSTVDQANGHGLDAQREHIQREAAHRGWQLVHIYEDTASGQNADRPGLTAALQQLDRGDAEMLVAAKLDRLSRSPLDFHMMLERARQNGWRIVVLDIGMDTSTPIGEAMAGMAAVFAQLERRRIGERTREGLAAAKAKGVKLGRRYSIPDDLADQIVRLYTQGWGAYRIASWLNDNNQPTARGGKQWYPSTVKRVLDSRLTPLAAP